LHDSAFISWYCYYLHSFMITMYTVFTIRHWHPRYRLWSCYTKSHTVLHLYWLIKSIKSGLLEETGSRRSGMYAWKGGALESLAKCDFMICDYVIQWLCTYLLLYETWVHWTVSPCYSGSTKSITCLICSCPIGCGTRWLN